MNCNKIIYDKNCNIIIQDTNYDNNYVFVYVLQLNQTTGTTSQVFIKTSEDLKIIFDFKLDGFYTLVNFKISKDTSNSYYYNNNTFYHNNKEIELLELIELNPLVSNIEINYNYYFLLCNLKKCFINICYLIFDSKNSICKNNGIDQNIIYKRDLIWSTINTIKFMVEMDQYEEAERLLERIMGCNGLCNNTCYDSNYTSNCGCK